MHSMLKPTILGQRKSTAVHRRVTKQNSCDNVTMKHLLICIHTKRIPKCFIRLYEEKENI